MDLAGVVPLETVAWSSEDPPHAGKQLSSSRSVPVLQALLHGRQLPDDAGWHAEKFCEYPQEIVFRVGGPHGSPRVSSVVVVSHATLIAYRVEVFLSNTDASEWRQARFERLGFITLQGPRETQCAAQEMKTVSLEADKLTFIRLLVHTCHVHTRNPFNQVGLVCVVALDDGADRTETLARAIRRRIDQENARTPLEQRVVSASRVVPPWPVAASPQRSKPSHRLSASNHSVWIAERNEYVTPVELLTRIQLARERHAGIVDRAAVGFQREQQQWAADELQCVQLCDSSTQLHARELTARTAEDRILIRRQIDGLEQLVRELDARVRLREVSLHRQANEALITQLANSPVRKPRGKGSPAKAASAFPTKDNWTSLPSWEAREEIVWKVVEAVKSWSDQQSTNVWTLIERAPLDCTLLDEAMQTALAALNDIHCQVFIAANTLLICLLERHPRFQEGSAWKQEVSSIIKLLVSRLEDGQPIVRNNAAFSLVKVAELTRAKGTFVVHTLLKLTEQEAIQLTDQKLFGLLKVLSALLMSFHCCATIDISVKRVLRFLVEHDALVHDNGHVREAARQLLVVLHTEVGSDQILTYIRKKRLPEETVKDIEQLMVVLTGRATKPPALLDDTSSVL